jgi:putative oxidoreductase
MATYPDASWANRTAKAILLIRILVGWVFLSEGIQKFLFADALGVGRFVKIGIPWPQVMAPFVGVVEIVCGSLLLIGLITRLAAIPLLIDICIASIPPRSSRLRRMDFGARCTKPGRMSACCSA